MKKIIISFGFLFFLSIFAVFVRAEADRGGGSPRGSGGQGGYSRGGGSDGYRGGERTYGPGGYREGHGGYRGSGGRAPGSRYARPGGHGNPPRSHRPYGYNRPYGYHRPYGYGYHRPYSYYRPPGTYRYSGYGGFFPGLFLGGILGWSLGSATYYPPAYYASPPAGYGYPPPPVYDYPPAPAGDQAPISTGQGPGGQMAIYPRQGQDEEEQARDFNDCHGWAVKQTGFDPAKPLAGPPDDRIARLTNDYLKVMGACLDIRGYDFR